MLTIELHSGPTGREWQAFVAECNGRAGNGDGAAPAATPQAVAAIAPQPVPSPPVAVQTMTGSTR